MARKKVVVKPEPVIYPMSKQVSFWMWLFFFLALVPFPYMAYIRFEDGELWGSALPLIAAMVFLFAAGILEKLRRVKIELSPTGIARVEGNGDRTFLEWGGIVVTREFQLGRGLVLADQNGTKKVWVDRFTMNFDVLLETVFEKLRKRMEAPRLPLVFEKAFRSILVEEKGITCRGFFKTYFLPWDGIERVDWNYFNLSWFGGRDLFIKLVMKSGYTIRVRPGFSVVGEMYLVLKKSFGKFGHPKRSNKAEEAAAAKTHKRRWLRPFAAGALLITFPGWFLGKVAYQMMDESGFWDLFGYLLVAAFINVFLLLLFRKESRVLPVPAYEEVPSKFNNFATNISFLILGFFLTGYFWWFTGKVALNHVKAEVVKAGYSLKMPENAPKLPDEKNAIYYMKKAARVPAAESLLYEDFKDKKPAYDKPYFGKNNEYDFLRQFCKDLRAGKLTKEKVAAASKLVLKHEETLRLVDKAFEKKGVDWGIDFISAPPHKVELPRVSLPYTLVNLLACRAYVQAREGKGLEAIKSLREGLFLADAEGEIKFLIGTMMELGFCRTILDAAKDVLLRTDARDFKKEIIPALMETQRAGQFMKSCQLDYFVYQSWFETVGWIEYIKFKNGESTFLEDGQLLRFVRGCFGWPFVPLGLARDYNFSLKCIDAFKLPFSKLGKELEKEGEKYRRCGWFMGEREFLFGEVSERFLNYQKKNLETLAYFHVTRAAVETRIFYWQNKRWPKSIKELEGKGEPFLDPFTDGEDLRFVPQKEGVFIYSIGPDGKDNAGVPRDDKSEAYDIGWLVKLPVLTAKAATSKPAADVIPAP